MSRSTHRLRNRTAVLISTGVLVAAGYGIVQYTHTTARPDAGGTRAAAPGQSTAAATDAGAHAEDGLPADSRPGREQPSVEGSAAPGSIGTSPGPAPEGNHLDTLEGAQLTPAQLPDSAAQGWQPLSPPHVQRLSQDFRLNECVTVHGAVAWQQQGFVSVHQTPAVQDSLSFPDQAAASAAYQRLLTAMDRCAQTSRNLQTQVGLPADASVTRTTGTADGTAWARRWTGVQGVSAPGRQVNHIYAVQHGRVLALLHFDEWAAVAEPAYDTRGDLAVLKDLGARLGVPAAG